MSTSDLYHIQGVKGYTQLPGTKYGAEGTVFKIEPQDRLIHCPACFSPDVVLHGSVNRVLMGIPSGSKNRILFDITIPKIQCRHCGHYGQIDTKISDPKKTYTKGFAAEVISLAREMSLAAVANYFKVSWGMVHGILEDYLTKKYSKSQLKGVSRISIDETSVGKGHKYVTVVLDLDSGNPIFVGDGKGEAALEPFWELLGNRAKRIGVVALDMGAAYISAVKKHLPKAAIVIDHFHAVKLMNQRLDLLRRQVFQQVDVEAQAIIRGSKYLILKNDENLIEEKGERTRLERVLELNTPLTKGYILKESLKQIWKKSNYEEARKSLEGWIQEAKNSGVKILEVMGMTMTRHAENSLNYFLYNQVTSAMIEGVINKIKALFRRAFGYRNMMSLWLYIMGIREFNPRKTFSSA
jgi:transposase